jgi:hypothetical protein
MQEHAPGTTTADEKSENLSRTSRASRLERQIRSFAARVDVFSGGSSVTLEILKPLSSAMQREAFIRFYARIHQPNEIRGACIAKRKVFVSLLHRMAGRGKTALGV